MYKLLRIVKGKPFIVALWFGLSLFAVVKSVVLNHIHNNYFVYKYNFIHVLQQQNLYKHDPLHYTDLNHYGPVFSIIIAPFALLPNGIGVILWVAFNAWILLLAIKQLN